MIYEVSNGLLKEISIPTDNQYTGDYGNSCSLLVDKIDDDWYSIIYSKANKSYLIKGDNEKNLFLHSKVFSTVNDKSDDDMQLPFPFADKITTFIIVLSYACNYKCKYCYQQNSKSLSKTRMSEDTLSSVLDVISEYLKKNTDRKVQIGLFGGEPLLVENYSLITKIFDFCVTKKISIGITTNGKNLDYYLKLLIIYRSLGITVCSTIDSIEDNEFTRTPVQLSKLHQNVTNELLSNVKLLIDNGVHVDLETNIDSHNIRKIGSIIDYYRNNGYLDNPFFTFGFGRVDDRFYETNYSRIVSYVDILTELSNINSIPSKMYISFLRSAYELARKIGMNYGQTELKIPGTYCWASSPLDTVFYVDPDLKTYRCTYTVGRSNYSIMDFTFDNIENYQLKKITSDDYNNCKSCPIAGYCAGGCKLSADIDFNRQCKDEKEQFYRFLHEIYYPKLLQLLYKRINK